jgi:uncharacterized membrane protein YeaQ/YmgE (transglycosylase-associated protein family)
MKLTDPIVVLLCVLAIGAVVGILIEKIASTSWLTRQMTGTGRVLLTSALVGIAGAFVGYHIGLVTKLTGFIPLITAAVGALVVVIVWRTAKI